MVPRTYVMREVSHSGEGFRDVLLLLKQGGAHAIEMVDSVDLIDVFHGRHNNIAR